jgi:hypothetical protein
VQGGSNGSLAQTTANVPVQLVSRLGNRHVGSAGSARAAFKARLHLKPGLCVVCETTKVKQVRLLSALSGWIGSSDAMLGTVLRLRLKR